MGNKTKSTRNKPRPTANGIPERRTMSRRAVDQEVIRREAGFRALIENCMDGISILNSDGTIRYESPSVERILGYKPEELIGKNVLEFVHPDDVQNVISSFNDTLAADTGQVLFLEVRFLHKDGSWRSIEGIGNNLIDDPVVNGIVVNYRDITERKRAEETLLLKEKAIENSVSAMAMSDMEGRVTYLNRACMRLWGGANKEELLGKPYWLLLKSDDVVKDIATAMFQNDAWEGEVVAVRKNGEEVIIQVSAGMVRDEHGNPIQTISSFLDITERKQAEEEKQRMEGHYSALVENLSDAVFHLRDGFVVWCNDKVDEIYGYTKDEFIGKDITFFLPDETDHLRFIKEGYKLIKERGHLHGTSKAKAKDGSFVDIEYSISKIPGRYPIELVGVARNITEHKRMEEQLHLAGRLAAVGELAAGVAHELNNPLTAVQAFAQFLAEKQDLDDTIKDDIHTIYQESQRAARITSNLLSFARKRRPEKRLISINEALDKSLELHSYRLKVNNIEVVRGLHPSLPWTMADFHQMQQVFVNIITNAEQAMTKAHGKGKLIVKTQKKGNVIQITFSDDGPGISEQDLKSIFNPFFTTKEVGEGTGLGLSICYGIVQEHNGHIYTKSKVDEGTTFVVEIPVISEDHLIGEEANSTHHLQATPRHL